MRRLALLLAGAALLAACGGDDGPAKVAELYDTAPPAAVPVRTDPVPASGELPDGTYWATADDADPSGITFTVVQAFFGPACPEQFPDGPCDNDIGVLDTPSRALTSPPAAITTATVVNGGTQVNYAVTGDELARLIAGQPPNTPQGVDFAYTPFPFLLTVRDGAVVTALQIWQP
jgi:hypothetical protein